MLGKRLIIITGQGIHSEGGVAKIKRAVIALLKEEKAKRKGKNKLVNW